MDSYLTLPVALVLIFLIYKLSVSNFDYWEKRDVAHPKPIPIIGNAWKIFTLQQSIFQYFGALYNQFQTPYFGVYVFKKPILVVRDLELAKQMFAKNFNHFNVRNLMCDEECDSLFSNMLFATRNSKWKNMRSQMSHFLSIKSIKHMYALMEEVSDDISYYIEENMKKKYVEAKELCENYVLDVIASCTFGVKANTLKSDDAEFKVIAQKTFGFSISTALSQSCYILGHSIVRLLKFPFLDSSVSDFLRSVFWECFNERNENNYKRGDLMDIILEAMKDQEGHSLNVGGDYVAAHVATMFIAGFETTSAVMAFALYELCMNPKVQTKLRDELRSAVLQDEGLTFSTLQQLNYLDMVIYETLRMYPPLAFLDRMCTMNYALPNGLLIEKGTPVFVPLYGIFNDPKYFPNPEEYNPDRFLNENGNLSFASNFVPFGLGPRDCIGKKFGFIMAKLGLARIILKYRLEACAETPVRLKLEAKRILSTSSYKFSMKFKKI